MRCTCSVYAAYMRRRPPRGMGRPAHAARRRSCIAPPLRHAPRGRWSAPRCAAACSTPRTPPHALRTRV
eukprot:scaffold130604_cov51-Phaeocystis_antarctica.AAC.1